MFRGRYLALVTIVVVGALLFSFFAPVIPVTNAHYLPDIHCPLFSSCPPAAGGAALQFSFIASPAFLYLRFGAFAYNGTYSISHIENPTTIGFCPTTNGSMTTCTFTGTL